MKDLQVLILAGGIGKRMAPLTINKSLIPFLGKPIIEHIIDDFINLGIKSFRIVTNSVNEKEIKKISFRKKVKILTSQQKKAKGMADAIITAKKILDEKPILIVNATDLLKREVFREVIGKAVNRNVLLAGLKVDKYLPGGYFKLKGNRVIGVVEKPGEKNMPSCYYKLVVDYYKSPKLLFDYIQNSRSRKDDVYEVAIDKIIKDGLVKMIKIKSYYQNVKYPWHILEIMDKFFKYRMNEEKVIIEKGVKIMKGAIVKGPAYVGKNTIIGNNALVRGSMIGDNCVVGYNTEIARSWVGNNAWFHCNYVGDSVIEGGSNFGSGARLANYRFDEGEIFANIKREKIGTNRNKFGAVIAKGVKLGINSSVMPGAMIKKNSIVKPGEIVYEK